MARGSKESTVVRSTWKVTSYQDAPIYVVGNTRKLGEWRNPLKMERCGDSVGTHHWKIDLNLSRGEAVEFKFVEIAPDGKLLWEEGDNRAFTPNGGDSAIDWGSVRSRAE